MNVFPNFLFFPIWLFPTSLPDVNINIRVYLYWPFYFTMIGSHNKSQLYIFEQLVLFVCAVTQKHHGNILMDDDERYNEEHM